MKIGLNLLLWTTHVTDEHSHLLKMIAEAGYDGVEIPVMKGTPEHYARLGKMIRDHGLAG